MNQAQIKKNTTLRSLSSPLEEINPIKDIENENLSFKYETVKYGEKITHEKLDIYGIRLLDSFKFKKNRIDNSNR
jgi:hypothetical protein